jgi:Pao retrotransposon peptidase
MGLISPVILVPKILLQEIWSLGVDWDTNLSGKLKTQWDDWCASLSHLPKVKIPRYYFMDQAEARQLELHLFSDASEKAYGTVAYVCRFEWKMQNQLNC